MTTFAAALALPTEQRIREAAYLGGMDAARAGRPRSANPYRGGERTVLLDDAGDAWDWGWRTAARNHQPSLNLT